MPGSPTLASLRSRLYDPLVDTFSSDAAADPPLSEAALRALVTGAQDVLTYTCAPPGSGVRMAVDRDEDDVLDFDEVTALTNPANPGSLVGACSDTKDNDGDGLGDPHCANSGDDTELKIKKACGLGLELAFLLPGMLAMRRRRSRRAAPGGHA